jgi:hypothetical protein
VFRAEALLKAYPDKFVDEISVADVGLFLHGNTQNLMIKGWLILQAIDAIRILCTEVLDRNRFSAVNWDDYPLCVKSMRH